MMVLEPRCYLRVVHHHLQIVQPVVDGRLLLAAADHLQVEQSFRQEDTHTRTHTQADRRTEGRIDGQLSTSALRWICVLP